MQHAKLRGTFSQENALRTSPYLPYKVLQRILSRKTSRSLHTALSYSRLVRIFRSYVFSTKAETFLFLLAEIKSTQHHSNLSPTEHQNTSEHSNSFRLPGIEKGNETWGLTGAQCHGITCWS